MGNRIRTFLGTAILLGPILAILPSLQATEPFLMLPSGSVWSYWDKEEAPAADWKTNGLTAALWPQGPAPLGHGMADAATTLDPVDDCVHAFYFQRAFVVANPADIWRLGLRLWRDDGAVVYLNGTEVLRNQLPPGPVTHETLATFPVTSGAERQPVLGSIWPGYLKAGTNHLAVSVHPAFGECHDSWFDLDILANQPYTPPRVRIVSPYDGSRFPSGPIALSVSTEDVDGYVYRVDYLAGTNLIGSTQTAPFGFIWNTPAPGRYALKALAIDNSGRRGYSDLVHIEVGFVAGDQLVRGPYLQRATPTSVTVRWRTDWFTTSRVDVGLTPQALTNAVYWNTDYGIDHEMVLTGLTPGTRYYYGVGTQDKLLASGTAYTFVTPPAETRPTRVWVIGDSGSANSNAWSVLNAYLDITGPTDVWLMLGDNAYEEGTDDQYQRAVFDMYPMLLRQTALWPTLGNHDASLPDADGRYSYLDIFTLPTQGEAGGLASGTEYYYAFDHANIHFICLDSQDSDRRPGSPMLTWLEQDLAATDKDWIIAFWHHPPYTFGTHNSDTERNLIEMRENVLPILERYGTDLVLTGHSHVYERSFLLNGHYGYSTNLQPSMVLDANPQGPYLKPAGGLGSQQGTLYAVCGCSGEGGYFNIPQHPAMAVSLTGFGSMILEMDGLRLNARFLRPDGAVADTFVLDKSVVMPAARPPLGIAAGVDPGRLRLSWPTSLTPFQLEWKQPGPETSWEPLPADPSQVGRRHEVHLPKPPGPRWFRLRGTP